mmetsp:Transcript_530/g.1155  ORF Transcript_530/g.1155 Transcript_530/m.1155 type:complete len:105 (-) Transcript_530:239-553(-)
MSFYNFYSIATSSSCDTHASIPSVADEQKRRIDSIDESYVAERSNKRKKMNSDDSWYRAPTSPIKLHGPFPQYQQSSLVGALSFPALLLPSASSTTSSTKNASC